MALDGPGGPDVLLEARDLSVAMAGRVIGPIDLTVRRGEIVVLRGPNGSGKTTTIRACIGLLRAATGMTAVRGKNVDPLHPPLGVGYLPDHLEFWEWLTAAQNLLPFASEPRDVEVALDHSELASVSRLQVRRLSRGMRQRLAIARALVGQPDLVVMDEPTVALDDAGLRRLVDLLTQRVADGCGMLIASHDSAFVDQVATTVVPLMGADR